MKDQNDTDETDGYLGNIWGWKISYLSLGLIVFMLTVMMARKCYLADNDLPIDHQIEAQN
ncbi:MAG: hypothetical protein HKN87_17110 [Saprospiraceae bacterium]|nr:hypothetical protein [Saprospiraceae bacterium]